MSRSRVSRGDPWAIAAIPPMTTKSTPCATSWRSSSARWNSGQFDSSTGVKQGLAGQVVLALKPVETLSGCQPEIFPDLILIDLWHLPRRGRQGDLLSQRLQGSLDSAPTGIGAACLETGHGGLRSVHPPSELCLRNALPPASFADDHARSHGETIPSLIYSENAITRLRGRL